MAVFDGYRRDRLKLKLALLARKPILRGFEHFCNGVANGRQGHILAFSGGLGTELISFIHDYTRRLGCDTSEDRRSESESESERFHRSSRLQNTSQG